MLPTLEIRLHSQGFTAHAASLLTAHGWLSCQHNGPLGLTGKLTRVSIVSKVHSCLELLQNKNIYCVAIKIKRQ